MSRNSNSPGFNSQPTGSRAAFAEKLLTPPLTSSYDRFEVYDLRLPLLLVLTGSLLLMDRLDVVHISHLAQLWPVILIAIGLQELYIGTQPGSKPGSTKR